MHAPCLYILMETIRHHKRRFNTTRAILILVLLAMISKRDGKVLEFACLRLPPQRTTTPLYIVEKPCKASTFCTVSAQSDKSTSRSRYGFTRVVPACLCSFAHTLHLSFTIVVVTQDTHSPIEFVHFVAKFAPRGTTWLSQAEFSEA